MYDPHTYQAVVIAKALELYSVHRLKVNKAYTPKAMMAMAGKITGKTFMPRDYVGAAKALRAWASFRIRNGVKEQS